MGFEHASIGWGAMQLSAMIKNGRIKFDNIIQRSYVWEPARKSLFIHSLIIGIPIPPTYAKRFNSVEKNNGKYDMLDGKQRMLTIAEFINDKFKLTELPPVTFYNELTDKEEVEDISGKRMSELSEGIQEKIKNSRINVVYFDNLTTEEERELFKRLNNGKPLTPKSKALASCKNIERLLDVGSHEIFTNMLSEKALGNKNQAVIVMKIWCMMNCDLEEVSFESKYFNPLLENTKISDEDRLKIMQILDLVINTHTVLIERSERKVARNIYTETHLVSLIPFFQQAIKEEINEERMADWVLGFYKTSNRVTSISEDYNNATGSGSAKNANIQIRHLALKNNFSEFFKVDEERMDSSILDAQDSGGLEGLEN